MSDEEIITRALLSVDFDVDYYDHPSRADDMPTRLRGADSISPTAAEYAAAVVAALREAGRLVPDGAVLMSGELWRRSVLIDAGRWERVLAFARAAVSVTHISRTNGDPGDTLRQAAVSAWEEIKPGDLAREFPR